MLFVATDHGVLPLTSASKRSDDPRVLAALDQCDFSSVAVVAFSVLFLLLEGGRPLPSPLEHLWYFLFFFLRHLIAFPYLFFDLSTRRFS